MSLPIEPPIEPMLARLSRRLPERGCLYEPKWDGFRCIAFRDADVVDLRSRHDRPLARYFPELVEALRALPVARMVLDGEIILAGPTGGGVFDFGALMSRLHPATSRVDRLSRETPAAYVAFDLLAVGDERLLDRPMAERRHRLEMILAGARAPVFITPATRTLETAQKWLDLYRGAGIDGVVAKPLDAPYEPGRRSMVKIKHERTADCVVAGCRLLDDQEAVSSLLLGLYDKRDDLRHIGVVTQFTREMRRLLVGELSPLEVDIADHPWRHGFTIGASPIGRLKGSAARWTPDMELDWIPLRPERVCEVGFDQVDVDRLRHAARFRRWRPDREPRSCRLDQIEVDPPDLAGLLGLGTGQPAATG